MEKPPVNPVDKVELPKAEQSVECFSFSEQEKNIQEVFKLSPELENIATEAIKSGETIALYRIENKNIEKEPDGITSHKDLKGQWFSPDLETALVYLRKSQQTFGIDAKRIEGVNLVVVKIPKEEFENLHVSKHPIASQMDVENDNYIVPENIDRNYINLDDVQDKVGNFENLQKAKEQIKEKVRQFESKEAIELYQEYLKTIFPESKVKDIVWHYSDAQFNAEGFKPMKPNFDTLNSLENVYNFSTNKKFVTRYGKYAYPVLLNIKNPHETKASGEYVDDMDRPLSEALFKIGKQTEKNILAPQYDEKLKDSDAVINSISGEDYIERHPVSGKEFGIPNQKIITVFNHDQIHILGTNNDVENFKKFVSRNKGENILEKQELYKQIMSEIENVQILENDRNKEGNLLAPNGKKSNLPELEWKMTRTSSFLKFFGNWKEKYNKEQYDLWLKYQELQSHEDWLKMLNEEIEHFRKHSTIKDEMIKSWQEKKVKVNHRISKLHAELINSGFNIHSYDLDYTKILDENGEPLLLYRGTDFSPDENAKFTIPKKNIHGKDFEVGVFFGNEQEAKHHHESRKTEGKNSKLYKVFVNGRNFKIFNSKPNYWDNPKDSKQWQGKYDGLWVKQNENNNTRTNEGVNLFDYVAFNPDDVLIADIE